MTEVAPGTRREDFFRIAVRRYGPFEQAIAAQWNDFEAARRTGLQLQAILYDLQPLEHELFAARGMENGTWDVAFIATDWIAAVQAQGCALDLADKLAVDPPPDFPEGWTDSLLRLQQVNGAVLGVPYHDGPECLIYRRDLFEDPELRAQYRAQFGRELVPPETWTDFHQVARFLQNPEQGLYGTAFAAFPDAHNSVYDFLLLLWSHGGELTDASGCVQLETPQAEAALALARLILRDSNAVHPDCRQLDSVKAGAAFAAGEVAMMVNWFGFAAAAETATDSTVRGKVGVAAVPHAEGQMHVSLNVYWILSSAAGSPHAEIAWQFLRHVMTPAMDKLTTTVGAIGCRRSTWRDPEVNAAIPFYRRIEELHAHAREIPQRSDWPQIAGVLDWLVSSNLDLPTSPRELLREAQRRVSGIPPSP